MPKQNFLQRFSRLLSFSISFFLFKIYDDVFYVLFFLLLQLNVLSVLLLYLLSLFLLVILLSVPIILLYQQEKQQR